MHELKKLQGSWLFSAFYLNDPVDEETVLVTHRHHHNYGGNGDTEPFETCHVCGQMHKRPKRSDMAVFTMIDPAVSQQMSADFSIVITAGIDVDDNWWILSCMARRMTTGELIETMFAEYQTWRPDNMSIETIGLAQAILDPIQSEERARNCYLPLVTIKSRAGMTKEARIRAVLQPRFERNKIFYKLDQDEFVDEVTKYPRCKRDDALDALSDLPEIGYRPDAPLDQRPQGGEGDTAEDRVIKEIEQKKREAEMGPLDEYLGVDV